jgi:hypothetical protein
MNHELKRNLGMTVAELKDLLDDYSDDLPVFLAYNYGDYWRTTVAAPVKSGETADVSWSDYHRMPKVTDDDESITDGVHALVLNLGDA